MADWTRLLRCIFLTLCCCILLSCNNNNSVNPLVNEGIIDLSNIEDTMSNPVRLDGTWKFYWQHIVKNKQQLKELKPAAGYINVPSAWNKQKHCKSHPSFGYGTYHVTILHAKNTIGTIMCIKMPFTYTSHEIYINNVLVARSGVVAKSKYDMTPQQLPAVIPFLVQSSQTDIFIPVANYQQRNGGILHSLYYGKPDHIKSIHERSIHIQFIIIASFFIIGIYHIALYVINKSKQNIFLGLFSQVVALRILVINDMLLISFFNPPWGINFRLSYLTITLTPILFCHFVNSIYPDKVNKYVRIFFDSYFGFFSVYVCLAPLHIISYSLIYIQMALITISVYLLFILLKETSKNLKTKRLFYFGLIAGFVCLLNDIFYSHQVLRTVNSSHIGILLFIATQSFIAFEEYLNQQKRFMTLSNEINIAKRIQQNILPLTKPELSGASVDVYYLPAGSIGGDFYHFYEIDDKHTGIFLADVTGHGIPASIIASTVYIAFSLQKEHAPFPDNVLSNINAILIGKTANQPVSAIYCYLDCDAMVMRFACAGHPYPLYYNASTKTTTPITTKGTVLGVFPESEFTVFELPLQKGDIIILYTDGLTELRNKNGKFYDIENLKAAIDKNKHLAGNEFAGALIDSALQWSESKRNQSDDITLVTIKII